MKRREFVKNSITFAASLGMPYILVPSASRSKVVIARNDELIRKNHQVIKERVAKYLDQALLVITGHTSPAAAWKSLFGPRETVGIKLSCLPGMPLSSSYGLVMAIVDGLLAAGLNEDNIIIWERTERELKKAGFPISKSGVKVLGTDQFQGDGYSNNLEITGSVGTRFSLIMEKVDALINVPVLKDHDLSGVSASMKNWYGGIFNPNKFHRNNCNPYLADLSTHSIIKEKQRLIVCDASRVQINNGPAFSPRYAWEYGGILVSRDPVALDYTGWQIIEHRRKQLKMKSLKQVERFPQYILTAEKQKLGAANPRNINTIKLGNI